jgi:ribosomal-protein-alanine N-acetyltransferase
VSWAFTRVTDPRDLDGVMAVDAACFNNPWTREDYLRELADAHRCWLVAARAGDGTIVAYCTFWRIFDEIHVNNFAVLPAWRRQGLGAALLAHVLATGVAIGAPRTTLEVRASNAPALALYRAAGFVEAAVRRGYYTKPIEDALVLWREPQKAS